MKRSLSWWEIVVYILSGLVLILGAVLFPACSYAYNTYHVSFTHLLYTMMSPIQGVGGDTVSQTLVACLWPVLPAGLFYSGTVILLLRRFPRAVVRPNGKLMKPKNQMLWIAPVICCTVLLAGLVHADRLLGVFDHVSSRLSTTAIYEDYYVAPESVKVTPPEQKQNLILIYAESMESTYASREEGGFQEENYIPGLTELAKDGVSFSHSTKLGGFHSLTNATWTAASLFTTASGVPYAFPYRYLQENGNQFAPKVTALGDILQRDGYVNRFLCGSDADFGGRRAFFREHGNHEIYDLFTARERGVLPEDYYVFWGFEDFHLFDIAKQELTQLAAQDKPFNLTMLTVDTHNTGGYVCDLCPDTYEHPTANVLTCSDRQLTEFVRWCQQQPFYENTVIVIVGDHPRNDLCLVEGIPQQSRTMYNCFLGNAVPVPVGYHSRQATTVDIFPTVLAAMGYEIQGDRLGLGTNLFSQKLTLAEELGYDHFNREVRKQSDYFQENIR